MSGPRLVWRVEVWECGEFPDKPQRLAASWPRCTYLLDPGVALTGNGEIRDADTGALLLVWVEQRDDAPCSLLHDHVQVYGHPDGPLGAPLGIADGFLRLFPVHP